MTTEITEAQLYEWQQLADAATPGPWEARPYPYGEGVAWYTATGASDDLDPRERETVLFIASARDAVPALISEIRRLRAELARARSSFVRPHREGT